MATYMMENFWKAALMVLGCTNGLMEKIIQESGKKTKDMVKEPSGTAMEENMLVCGRMI